VTRPQNDVLTVRADEAGMRLDRFCAARIESLSRTQIQKLNAAGAVTVDGRSRPDHYSMSEGESVAVVLPEVTEEAAAPQPQDLPLRIAYEDDHIVVINKHADFVVHPAHGNRDGTVVNALLGRGVRLATTGGPDRPGIVHRLDKDTTGLMVVAKTDEAYHTLAEAIKERRFRKTYHAIVWGNLGVTSRRIEAAISRHPVDRQKMSVARRGGRPAVTEVFPVDSFEYFDYIRVVTLTGRTHQIRVHLAHISHPILGDPTYGGGRKRGLPSDTRLRNHIVSLAKAMARQALHASRLSFEHPVTGALMNFKAALPEDMRNVLESLHSWNKEAGS
jgi:23S rRNA pseudouridine1911/1915/1917 synthase